MLSVVALAWTLRVRLWGGTRSVTGWHSHAERGNDQVGAYSHVHTVLAIRLAINAHPTSTNDTMISGHERQCRYGVRFCIGVTSPYITPR